MSPILFLKSLAIKAAAHVSSKVRDAARYPTNAKRVNTKLFIANDLVVPNMRFFNFDNVNIKIQQVI